MRITLMLKPALLMVFLLLNGCDHNKASISSEVGDILAEDTTAISINGPSSITEGDLAILHAYYTEKNFHQPDTLITWSQTSNTVIDFTSMGSELKFTASAVAKDTAFTFFAASPVTDMIATLERRVLITNFRYPPVV